MYLTILLSCSPALLLFLIIFLLFSLYHFLKINFHLLRSQPTSLQYTNMVQKQIIFTTHLLAVFKLTAKSWNPSSRLTANPSFSSTVLSHTNSSDSNLLTPLWTCCFSSLYNGWRPSISDMRPGPSLWTYLEHLIKSGNASCSPNPLPLAFKATSCHGLMTFSTVKVSAWLL